VPWSSRRFLKRVEALKSLTKRKDLFESFCERNAIPLSPRLFSAQALAFSVLFFVYETDHSAKNEESQKQVPE